VAEIKFAGTNKQLSLSQELRSYMKKDLLRLIEETDSISSLFHKIDGVISCNLINDQPEFAQWKQELLFELTRIHGQTKDSFIWGMIVIIKQGFDGWRDEKSFNDLRGGLLAIQKNINSYYPDERDDVQIVKEAATLNSKQPKVIISHSCNDSAFVSSLVTLLEAIGLNSKQLLCSSVPGYGIPLGSDIYDYLREQFQNYNLHVIFVLSKNYYDSAACMNEMGAAWVLLSKYTMILLPSFDFKEIKGAVNPRQISIKLDADEEVLKESLRQLKDNFVQEFGLSEIPVARWENKRDEFIRAISQQNPAKYKVSEYALNFLQTANGDKDGILIKTTDLVGLHISANNKEFTESEDPRVIANWEAYFDELVKNGFIKVADPSGVVFKITKCGYDYLDSSAK